MYNNNIIIIILDTGSRSFPGFRDIFEPGIPGIIEPHECFIDNYASYFFRF